MTDWKPRIRDDLNLGAVDLSADDLRLLTLVDGRLSVPEIASLTGLQAGQVSSVLSGLIEMGLVEPPPESGSEPRRVTRRTDSSDDEAEETPPENEAEAPEEERTSGDERLADEERQRQSANLRQLFETELHGLPVDQRRAMAGSAEGATLAALCLDPDPRVVRAVLENARAGLDHARLIADHHRNPAGLEAVVARVEFARDGQVRRLLLRNPQTSDGQLRRLLGSARLDQLFQVQLSREVGERAKRIARETLRQRWQRAQGEECAGLIFRTEGRCLPLLIGLHLDGPTTALLCRRTITSSLLVQNLARFPATPPAVLKHLYHQALLRRAPHLKRLILQHANCPAELKKTL